jgi:hypothetical protein
MQTYIRINNRVIPATISGRLKDKDWDDRPSKSIHLNLSYEEAINLFHDDVKWEIGQEHDLPLSDNLAAIPMINYFDNSDYSIVGDIIVHTNNSITVKMGCPTAEELLTMIMEGIEE